MRSFAARCLTRLQSGAPDAGVSCLVIAVCLATFAGIEGAAAESSGGIDSASVTCDKPHVADGDTITCAGIRVRIFGINAPELSHPDLAISEEPGGRAASARMFALTRTQVRCFIAGNQWDRYGRMVAKCGTAATPDLGAGRIRQGLACQWIRYSRHAYDGLGRDCGPHGK